MDKIREKDQLSILGLKNLVPGSQHSVHILRDDGSQDDFLVGHSLYMDHIKWFQAGSAINLIRK